MPLLSFGSAKGSPGVTTTLAALAATWPADRPLLVVEADPSGGDFAVRADLLAEPNLVTLAAAGRRELTPEIVLTHAQLLPAYDSKRPTAPRFVLTAPVAVDQAGIALHSLRGRLAPALDALKSFDVLVDCGRLDPGSPSVNILPAAELLVVVVRPVVAEVHHLAARAPGLEFRQVSLLTVGEDPYDIGEIAEATGLAALASLPHDARAAAALAGSGVDSPRVFRRSRLLRSAASVGEALAQWLGPLQPLSPELLPAEDLSPASETDSTEPSLSDLPAPPPAPAAGPVPPWDPPVAEADERVR